MVDIEPTSIADAIIKYYDHDLESSFTESVKEEKKKYQWSFFVERLLEFYNNKKAL